MIFIIAYLYVASIMITLVFVDEIQGVEGWTKLLFAPFYFPYLFVLEFFIGHKEAIRLAPKKVRVVVTETVRRVVRYKE